MQAEVRTEDEAAVNVAGLRAGIPCSRHEPKIAGSDDAKVVGD
jgi:hypothetical protein